MLFNTDLKSYSKTSIGAPNIRGALKSLAQTIDCARVSQEWQSRYDFDDGAEVRGLLFVYNHDAEFDDSFERFLVPERVQQENDADEERVSNIHSIPLEANQVIHMIEPRTIAYLQTIVNDAAVLHRDGTLPARNYYFFYPDQKLHKVHSERLDRPATVELLCGPYLIVGHDAVYKLNEVTEMKEQTFGSGYVIYYNRPGNTHLEFMYLFDVLSSYQILDGENQIRIRVTHHSPHAQIKSNYKKAINDYVHDWGFAEYLSSKIEAIDFQVLNVMKQSFSKAELGWERDK